MGKIRFSIDRHRVIDAAPIACVLTLLSFPSEIPPVIPVALLQVWLWLRHPRDGSRYVIAMGVFALYFAVSIGPPLFHYYMEYVGYGEVLYHPLDPRRMLSAAAIAAATGIFPILYRWLSRCSLASTEQHPATAKSKPRGSIIDILFLSLFCAVTFVALRWDGGDAQAGHRILPMVVFSICTSVGAVWSMRLLSRVKGIAVAVNFLFAWAAVALLTVAGERFARLAMDDAVSYPYEWIRDFQYARDLSFAFVWLPLFALVNRRCGVILARTHTPNRVKEEQPGFAGRMLLWIGQFSVVTLVAAVCLAPVVLPQNDVVAGWPWNYVYLETSRDGSFQDMEFDAIFLSRAACLADLLCAVLIALAIFPPRILRSRLPQWKLRATRWTVLLGFALLMVHTCVIQPRRLRSVTEKFRGISYAETYVGSPIPAMLSFVEAESDWIPPTDRNQIQHLETRRLDREMSKLALSLPRLREVTLVQCDVSQSAIEQLRGSPFLNQLALTQCKLEKTIGSVVESLPRLQSLNVSASQMPAEALPALNLGARLESLVLHVDHRGPLHVPDTIKFLTLTVPDDRSEEIEIRGAANLEIMHVRHTTAELAAAVTHLRLGRVPKLRILELDNSLRVDLVVADAPVLTTITDRGETQLLSASRMDDFGLVGAASYEQLARLRGLALSHAPYLKLLHADLSEFRFETPPAVDRKKPRPVINDFLLNLRRHATVAEEGRMPAAEATATLQHLARDFDIRALTIRGAIVDQALVNTISESFSITELTLADCTIPGDAFDVANKFEKLILLDVASYVPDDQQFQRLLTKLPKLRDIAIDGSKLTTLPASFTPRGRVYLRGAGHWQPVSATTIGNPHSWVTFGRGEFEQIEIELQPGLDPVFWMHGDSAGGKTLQFLRSRLAAAEPIPQLILLAPSATKADLQDYNWGSTERLHVIDARIDNETVKSWNLSGVQLLDVSRSDVSIDVLTILQQKTDRITTILLNDIRDTQSPLPDLSQFADLQRLELRGRAIGEADVEELIRSVAYLVDLNGCELSAAARERVARHQATGKPPELLSERP